MTLFYYHKEQRPGESAIRILPEKMPLCPLCEEAGSPKLILYDSTHRKGREINQVEVWYLIPRGECPVCHAIHRMLPQIFLPYKQYLAKYIAAAIHSDLPAADFADVNGWETSPSEISIERWRFWSDQSGEELKNNPLYACLSKKA